MLTKFPASYCLSTLSRNMEWYKPVGWGSFFSKYGLLVPILDPGGANLKNIYIFGVLNYLVLGFRN